MLTEGSENANYRSVDRMPPKLEAGNALVRACDEVSSDLRIGSAITRHLLASFYRLFVDEFSPTAASGAGSRCCLSGCAAKSADVTRPDSRLGATGLSVAVS